MSKLLLPRVNGGGSDGEETQLQLRQGVIVLGQGKLSVKTLLYTAWVGA